MQFRTFIVEDSSTIRDNLIETMRELARIDPVGAAETEHEGKRWLAANPDGWDIAIVDLFLRVGSGLNVLEACAARKKAGQKIIVLSNHATRDVRWRCQQLGADAVFDKSTELEALMAYVRECGQPPRATETAPRSEPAASVFPMGQAAAAP
jgi:DNA-binding NarL/FixJ family response regulator